MPNRLAEEKSPYLLQHAENPVDWYPWCEAAFERAKAENKPVFLSIGYATCHWCHVMAHESFEDPEAARHLNEVFVCIKVDREERPDIDSVYMMACQMLTGAGGWPLTIIMTPDKQPFYAATYLPKQTRFGRIGLIDLCNQIGNVWRGQPQQVQHTVAQIAQMMDGAFAFTPGDQLDHKVLDQAWRQIARSFDPVFGGFDKAPKFPSPHRLLFLLRTHYRTGNNKALDMVTTTLTQMRLGGIWDHVGYGFHRYATDKKWLLPHFEKMLYDQAYLALAYLEAFQITGDRLYARTAEDIFTYVLRDMTADEGGFYAAEDADSEGEEGKFYVWTAAEFRNVGQDLADHWGPILGVNEGGNFNDEATGRATGANILHLKQPLANYSQTAGRSVETLIAEWETLRKSLFDARIQRVHPLKDDKILTDWNGMMITALAAGARILQRSDYLEAAEQAMRFVKTHLRQADGGLLHRFRTGEAGIAAHADDYACLIMAALELYRSTFKLDYLQQAIELQNRMIDDFWDTDGGGFFLTAADQSELPVRPKELYDGAVPSANSTALLNLLRLARLTGKATFETRAQALVQAFSGTVLKQPAAFTHFLSALDFGLSGGQEVVISGDPEATTTRDMLTAVNQVFAPNKVVLMKSEQNAASLSKIAGYTDGLQVVSGQTTAHLCQGFACQDVADDTQTLIDRLGALVEKGPKSGEKA